MTQHPTKATITANNLLHGSQQHRGLEEKLITYSGNPFSHRCGVTVSLDFSDSLKSTNSSDVKAFLDFDGNPYALLQAPETGDSFHKRYVKIFLEQTSPWEQSYITKGFTFMPLRLSHRSCHWALFPNYVLWSHFDFHFVPALWQRSPQMWPSPGRWKRSRYSGWMIMTSPWDRLLEVRPLLQNQIFTTLCKAIIHIITYP